MTCLEVLCNSDSEATFSYQIFFPSLKSVPLDLDVKCKATLMGALFLVVSKVHCFFSMDIIANYDRFGIYDRHLIATFTMFICSSYLSI